jgi:hypothetical protein
MGSAGEYRAHVEYRMPDDCYWFWLTHRRASGELSAAISVEFAPRQIGEYSAPVLTFQHGEMQELMDSLWRAGLRPTDARAGDAQVAAMKAHLDDMRRLVFEAPGAGK